MLVARVPRLKLKFKLNWGLLRQVLCMMPKCFSFSKYQYLYKIYKYQNFVFPEQKYSSKFVPIQSGFPFSRLKLHGNHIHNSFQQSETVQICHVSFTYSQPTYVCFVVVVSSFQLLNSLQWNRVPSILPVRTKSQGNEVILSTYYHSNLIRTTPLLIEFF